MQLPEEASKPETTSAQSSTQKDAQGQSSGGTSSSVDPAARAQTTNPNQNHRRHGNKHYQQNKAGVQYAVKGSQQNAQHKQYHPKAQKEQSLTTKQSDATDASSQAMPAAAEKDNTQVDTSSGKASEAVSVAAKDLPSASDGAQQSTASDTANKQDKTVEKTGAVQADSAATLGSARQPQQSNKRHGGAKNSSARGGATTGPASARQHQKGNNTHRAGKSAAVIVKDPSNSQQQAAPATQSSQTHTSNKNKYQVKEKPSKQPARKNQNKGQQLQQLQQMQQATPAAQVKHDGGAYDAQGFYIYQDGSFLDPDGYQFDKQGYDELGGHYDDNNIYHPPQESAKLQTLASKQSSLSQVASVAQSDNKPNFYAEVPSHGRMRQSSRVARGAPANLKAGKQRDGYGGYSYSREMGAADQEYGAEDEEAEEFYNQSGPSYQQHQGSNNNYKAVSQRGYARGGAHSTTVKQRTGYSSAQNTNPQASLKGQKLSKRSAKYQGKHLASYENNAAQDGEQVEEYDDYGQEELQHHDSYYQEDLAYSTGEYRRQSKSSRQRLGPSHDYTAGNVAQLDYGTETVHGDEAVDYYSQPRSGRGGRTHQQTGYARGAAGVGTKRRGSRYQYHADLQSSAAERQPNSSSYRQGQGYKEKYPLSHQALAGSVLPRRKYAKTFEEYNEQKQQDQHAMEYEKARRESEENFSLERRDDHHQREDTSYAASGHQNQKGSSRKNLQYQVKGTGSATKSHSHLSGSKVKNPPSNHKIVGGGAKGLKQPMTAADLVWMENSGPDGLQESTHQSSGSKQRTGLYAQEGAARKLNFEPNEFKIYERTGHHDEQDTLAQDSHGNTFKTQGGPLGGFTFTTRGTFRGGRGGRPTPKPVFAQYSSDGKMSETAEHHMQHQVGEDSIPFSIISPEILRVKGEAAKQKLSKISETDESNQFDHMTTPSESGFSLSLQQTQSLDSQQQRQHKLFSMRQKTSDQAPSYQAGSQLEQEMQEVKQALLTMQKNTEQALPSQIDPAVTLQYQQIMCIQLQEKLQKLKLQLSADAANISTTPMSGTANSDSKEGDQGYSENEQSSQQQQRSLTAQQNFALQQQALDLQQKVLLAQQRLQHVAATMAGQTTPGADYNGQGIPDFDGGYGQQQQFSGNFYGGGNTCGYLQPHQVFQPRSFDIGHHQGIDESAARRGNFFDDQRGSDSVNQDDTEEYRQKQSEISAMLSDHDDDGQSLFISNSYNYRNQGQTMMSAGGNGLQSMQLQRGVSEYTPQLPRLTSGAQFQEQQNSQMILSSSTTQAKMNTKSTPFQPPPANSLKLVQNSFSAPGGGMPAHQSPHGLSNQDFFHSNNIMQDQDGVGFLSPHSPEAAGLQDFHNQPNLSFPYYQQEQEQHQHMDMMQMMSQQQEYDDGMMQGEGYYDDEDGDGDFQDDGNGGGRGNINYNQQF